MEHDWGFVDFILNRWELGLTVHWSASSYSEVVDLIFDPSLSVKHFLDRSAPLTILNTFRQTSVRVTRLSPTALNLRRSVITAFVLLLDLRNLVIFLRASTLNRVFEYPSKPVYLATSLSDRPLFPFLGRRHSSRSGIVNLNIILIHNVLCLTPYHLRDTIYK